MIFIVPLTFFMMYSDIFEAYLRAYYRTFFTNFLKEVVLRVLMSIVVIGFAFKWLNFDNMVLFYSLTYGVVLIIVVLYLKNHKILFLKPDFSFFKKDITKEIVKYLLYIIPGAAGSIIAQKIDTLTLGAISGKNANEGLENVAIYSLAYFIGSVIEVPRRSISQISIPLLANAFKENNIEAIKSLYVKNSLIQFISGVFIFGLIWINVDDLFLFIPHAEIYKAGKYVILLIGISKLFDMATSINNEIIQFSKYFRFNLIAIILLGLITVIMNLIFIPLYAILGAALALVLTLFAFNIIKTIFIWHKMRILPFSKEMIPISIVAVIAILIPFVTPMKSNNWVSALIYIPLKSILFSGFFLIIIRIFRISTDINVLIDNFLSKIRSYLNYKN
jgi:O-antigen/teichoic acid export membrane protein